MAAGSGMLLNALLADQQKQKEKTMSEGATKKVQETIEKTGQPVPIVDLKVLAARAAHEVNRAYCQSLGDDSFPPWEEAPEWQKKSIYQGVTSMMEHPSITPEQQHALWLAHKRADGWTYGSEKNEKTKRHPCMVPFGDLPPEQQLKDILFQAAVRGVMGILPK